MQNEKEEEEDNYGGYPRRVELWSGGTTYQVENARLDEVGMVQQWSTLSVEERRRVTQLVADGNRLRVLPLECVEWFSSLKYLWLQRVGGRRRRSSLLVDRYMQ